MEKIVSKFLHSLKIPFSEKYVEKLIVSHAEYPSLLSIVDSFERLGLNYRAGKVKREELNNINFPYLLPISAGGGNLILIENVDDIKRNEKELHYWDGVILQAESTQETIDKDNNRVYSEERLTKLFKIIFICVAGATILLPFFNAITWFSAILLISATSGVIVGYFLIAKDLGIKYQAIESFCNAGKNTNCDKILNSEDSKILGLLKFSDAVIIYFVFQTITLSLLTASQNLATSLFSILCFLSLLTIPTVIFSIHYQYARAKTWCKLCLIVDALLSIQALLFVYAFDSDIIQIQNVTIFSIIISLSILLLVSTSFLLFKGIVEKLNKSEQTELKAFRVKNSISVFTHLLYQQRKIDDTSFTPELLIGRPNAPIKLMMASNLYCNPCKEQHKKAAQLIANYPDKINLSIRFLLSGKDVDQNPTTNQYILQYWKQNIYARSNESETLEKLMHDWYSLMDLERFKIEYPLNMEIDNSVKELEASHIDWVKDSGVTHTPKFFINGHELPKDYGLEDLLMLAPGLADHFIQSEARKIKVPNNGHPEKSLISQSLS